MITTDQLLHTLIERGRYDQLRGYHQTIRQAVAHMREDHEQDRILLRCALDFAERYDAYPAYQQLEEYVSRSPHVDSRIDGQGLASMRCHEIAEADIPIHQGSWPQILDEYVIGARQAMYVESMKNALACIVAKAELPTLKTGVQLTDAERVTAALKYLDEVRRKDFTLPPSSPEGAWTENADLSADALVDALKDTISDRCYTGFKHIDRNVVIGPKQSIRFIGILAYYNHGKSTLLRQMAYNMAESGKRILYIAREDSALNTWTQLSFLHAKKRSDLDIPSAKVWRENPRSISAEHQDNLRVLIEDLQYGGKVRGEVVVKTLDRWQEIVRELDTGLNGKPYDVLMVDYLAHLKTEHGGAKRRDEVLEIFTSAQALAQDYKGGRGLVVITPLQANKQGMKAADEAEGEDWGVLGADAIEQYTDAGRDMDLIISVWHKDPLRVQDMMKIGCMKSREGRFATHFLRIDPRTRAVLDLPGGPKSDVMKISTYRHEVEEAELTPEEIAVY